MEQRLVGHSGLAVSRLGLGTLTWGRDTDEAEAGEQLKSFADVGGTLVDTSATYGDGVAEELLGSLMDSLLPREDLVICTKGGAAWRDGTPSTFPSRGRLLADLDASLRRLDTDHVDLWLVRGWSDVVPIAETLSALETAVSSGRARYVGVSNYTGWQVARAATLAAGSGSAIAANEGSLVAAQVEYSLLQRGAEREVVPASRALGLGILAWSPLGRGVLTGKYRTGTPSDSRGASAHLSAFVGAYLNARGRRVVDAVATAADGLGCSAMDVALAWVRQRPGVAAVLLGARTGPQLREALATDEVDLPTEIIKVLDEVSSDG